MRSLRPTNTPLLFCTRAYRLAHASPSWLVRLTLQTLYFLEVACSRTLHTAMYIITCMRLANVEVVSWSGTL